MKKCSVLPWGLLLLFIPIISFSQSRIYGTLLDNQDEPVVYANVVVKSASDSSLVKLDYSNESGKFLISGLEPAAYFLDISFVGSRPFRSEIIDLSDGGSRDMGTLTLANTENELAEVEVVAEKPLLEIQADKMVVNVENTINATGNTALELLRKSPGVVVDNNNNINLLGRSGVRVFIDGKPSPLRGDDLANYLQSLQSTDIEAIEIITSPSAKYEAEGNAGIINIRLKKDKNLGANGNVTAGFSIGEEPWYNLSGNGNYRTQKINLFGSYSYSDGLNPQDFNLYREQNGLFFDQRSNEFWKWQSHNYKVGLDYFLNPKNTLGVMITGNYSDNESGNDSRTGIGQAGTPEVDSFLVAKTQRDMGRNNANFNLNYQFEDKKGQSLNIDLDYGFFRNDNLQNLLNAYEDPGENILSESYTRINSPTDIDMYTGKLDYERPIGEKGKLGLGGKFAQVNTDNQFKFFNVRKENGVDLPVLDSTRSNDFLYKENVNALYATYNHSFEKFSFMLGLRTEQTNSVGELTRYDSPDRSKVDRSYIDFFPSASLTYTPAEKHSFQLSYTRRINRPNYQDLNPFEYKLDELTFQKGNPFLNPEYASNVQLTHTFNYRLNTTFSFSHTRDRITRLTDTTGVTGSFITWLNLAKQYNYSLSVSAPITITEWWSVYGSVTGYYTQNRGDFDEEVSALVVDVDVFSANVYGQMTFKLPKDFTLELSGWYNTPSLWEGTFEMRAMGAMDFGVQWKLWDGRANLKASVTDIFRTNRWYGVSDTNTLFMIANGGWDSRRFRLNLSILLGNKQVKTSRRRKTGLEDEQSRVKSGGG